MAATELVGVFTNADDITFTFTLSGSGTLDGTCTATIYAEGQEGVALAAALTGHAMTITSGANRTVTLTITDTEAASFRTHDHFPYTEAVRHIGDVKNVASDNSVTHYGPFVFQVRKAVT